MKLNYPVCSDGINAIVQNTFGGINNTESACDGEIFDMLNMTCDKYPVLSTRQARGEYLQYNYGGVLDVCDMADRTIVINQEDTGVGLCFARVNTDGLPMGTLLFDFEYGFDKNDLKVTSFNNRLAVFYKGQMCSVEIKEDDEGKEYFYVERIDKMYDGGSNSKFDDEHTYLYVDISVYNNKMFEKGDVLTITDRLAEQDYHLKLLDIRKATFGNTEQTEETAQIEETEQTEQTDLTLLVFDYVDSLYYPLDDTFDTYFTIARKVPPLEHVCANRDRIWGTVGNEIYSCASGDMRSWYKYDITAGASASFQAEIYAVSRFVGCASFGGNVYFFTTEDVYRMYGTTPSAFSLVTLGTYGCEEYSGGSFGVTAHRLFYNSTHGPVMFDGETARLIGRPLGNKRFSGVLGIGCGGKYYMYDGGKLYVYDTRYGTWSCEDTEELVSMIVHNGRLVLAGANRALYAESANGDELTEESSYVEFADICEGSVYGVTAVDFTFRVRLGEGAKLTLSMSCDGEEFHEIWNTENAGKRTYTVRFSPRIRCDSYRLRFEGVGEWKLYSLVRSYSTATNIRYGG